MIEATQIVLTIDEINSNKFRDKMELITISINDAAARPEINRAGGPMLSWDKIIRGIIF